MHLQLDKFPKQINHPQRHIEQFLTYFKKQMQNLQNHRLATVLIYSFIGNVLIYSFIGNLKQTNINYIST